jgi:RHS repeat-associated protein
MVNTVNGADRYDYDANGNVTVRNKGLSTQQSLTWSDENRLVSVTGSGANLPEWSLYDPDGQRVKKINNSTIATYYPFPHYEVENGTVVKYYFFNGQRVAMRRGGTLYYLHGDHLGSTHFVTKSNGTEQSNQSYYAYGRTRLFFGSTPSDHKFTGQKLDAATGLYYYNARYYDPVVGTFLSPDTLIPDPTSVWDYNRFAYVRGNPLKYTDPSGHETSKPEGWPDWLPYTWDLPDSLSMEGITQWVSENNIPTVVGVQAGFDAGVGYWIGLTGGGELQASFNWWSGELVYTANTSAAARLGSPQATVGVHAGFTFVSGASSTRDGVVGASIFTAIDAQANFIAEIGGSGTVAQAYNFEDLNHDGQFGNEGYSEPLTNPYMDPVFNRAVDSLSINATGGIGVSLPLNAGKSWGIADTNEWQHVNVYDKILGR